MLFLLFGQIHIKKTWTRLLPFHILEAFALPTIIRTATQSPRRYKQAYYTTMYRYAHNIPISRKHLSLQYPELRFLKVAKFLKCQNMRNKRFNIKFITPTPRISIRILGVRLTFTNVIIFIK